MGRSTKPPCVLRRGEPTSSGFRLEGARVQPAWLCASRCANVRGQQGSTTRHAPTPLPARQRPCPNPVPSRSPPSRCPHMPVSTHTRSGAFGAGPVVLGCSGRSSDRVLSVPVCSQSHVVLLALGEGTHPAATATCRGSLARLVHSVCRHSIKLASQVHNVDGHVHIWNIYAHIS